MSTSAMLTINIDGAARGNPGPAAYAYIITGGGHPVIEEAGCLGSATNNVAEYTALVKALQRAAEVGGSRLQINSDSELLVKQMNGQYRVKNEQLRDLFEQAKAIAKQFDLVTIRHVPREENCHADRLCNEVLDGEAEECSPRPSRKTHARSTKQPARNEAVREEAVHCLKSAARAWAMGDPAAPTPEQVWDQLWSILEENGIA
jgi:ribonuclease HI